jgi:hypothetical protein
MSVEVAVLELDPRSIRTFGDELDLDLAGVGGVSVELAGGAMSQEKPSLSGV